MGIGTSILLIALGAILRFAVHLGSGGFNIGTVGTILMIVGALGMIIGFSFVRPRRRSVVEDDTGHVVEERRVYERRPPL